MTAVEERPGRVTNKDTGERHYEYPPTGELLDSVTTVIEATNSKPWLKGWYGRSSMAYAVDNLQLVGRTLKEHGRDAAIALGEDAAQRIRDIRADAGTYVHDVQERLILWAASPDRLGADIALPVLPEHLENALYGDEPVRDVVEFMVDGFLNFVADFAPLFTATEMPVYNQPLGIAGTLDFIAEFRSYGLHPEGHKLVPRPGSTITACVDTKTGKSPEGTWKEQLAAYRRMTECRPTLLDDLHPMPLTDCGMVLHLRPEYPDGYLLMLVAGSDDKAAWLRFQKAAVIYRERQKVKDKPGKSVRALREDGTMPGPRICDLAGEGWGRALSPLGKALGTDCELEYLAKFTAADLLAVKGVGPKLIESTREMLAAHGLYLQGEELSPVLQAIRETAGPEVH